MHAMRCLRSYRFFLTLCFITGLIVIIRRLNSINKKSSELSLKILSNKINERLHYLEEHFAYINISMLLNRPSSDTSPSITYLCRELCGGWGDRLRGITSTFILAVLTGRRFYIDMSYPCELKNFLKPHLYNWQSIEYSNKSNRTQLHIVTTQNDRTAQRIYEKISSTNFLDEWSKYNDIYLTTNSDYITPILRNEYFSTLIRLLNISSDESSQARLFPLLFELLFQPTYPVRNLVDNVLNRVKQEEKQLICLHIRIGKNPTMINDKMLSYRDTIVEDTLEFIKNNLTQYQNSFIFITSDSMEINKYILNKYSSNQVISIPGPIIHIDRVSSSSYSSGELYQGFLKVISDFYVLGECDTLIMARSGFSEWASRRRYIKNQFHQLYLYCRGIHQITGHTWRRPHKIC